MLVIFILGFFLDFIEIAVVVVPIVAPILLSDPSANITAVWLGVMIGLNIQTSFLTPPFGFALFYLRGVASKAVKTIEMYKGVIPFITLQLIALAVVGSYPYLVNYLPNRLSFTSETSPPPKNPKLQLCIENFMKENVLSDKNATKNSINSLANADLTTLPKEYKKIIVNSIANINNGFDNLSNAFEIQSQINIESIQYLPKLKVVRDKEKNIREFKKLIKDNKTSISRLDSDETEKKLTLKNENKLLNEKINNEKLNFPNNWINEYKTFQNLIKSENINRNKYRRSVDSSYEEIEIIHNILNKKDTLYKFEKDFIKFDNVLETNDPKILSKEINKNIRSILAR